MSDGIVSYEHSHRIFESVSASRVGVREIDVVAAKKKARVLRTKVTVDAALSIPKRKMKVIS